MTGAKSELESVCDRVDVLRERIAQSLVEDLHSARVARVWPPVIVLKVSLTVVTFEVVAGANLCTILVVAAAFEKAVSVFVAHEP